MSTPLLQQDVKHGQTKRQKALMVIACVLPVVFAAIALPAFVGDSDEPVVAPAAHPVATGAAPTPSELVPELAAEDAPEVDPNAVETSMEGDLELGLALGAKKLAGGQTLVARIEYTNHSLDDLHLPAAGEPNPTLAVVVLDSEGMEVRRIVEKGQDPLPSRTMLLPSGTRQSVPVTIIARGEEPLPPGHYSAHAEFSPDPAWKRLGLRTWEARNGLIRSFPVFFDVTP